jgi:hypothetical protein
MDVKPVSLVGSFCAALSVLVAALTAPSVQAAQFSPLTADTLVSEQSDATLAALVTTTATLDPQQLTTRVGASLGTFVFPLPPQSTIASATVSGSFTDNRPLFSPTLTFFLDNILIGTASEGTFSFQIPDNVLPSLIDNQAVFRFTSATSLTFTYTFQTTTLTVNSEVIPEPSSVLGLLALGLTGGAMARRWRTKLATR